jgi:hypothetical protein
MKPVTSHIMYDILSLTNSVLLTVDMILLCKKTELNSFSFPLRYVYSPVVWCYCLPTKSNLYLDSFTETVIRETALYKLCMFHMPNLTYIFCCLGHLSKESEQTKALVFRVEGLLAPHPTPKLEDHSLIQGDIMSFKSYQSPQSILWEFNKILTTKLHKNNHPKFNINKQMHKVAVSVEEMVCSVVYLHFRGMCCLHI